LILSTKAGEARPVRAVLALPDERVGDALRALSWSGREEAGSVLKQLRGKLTPSDRDTLLTLRGRLPSWLAQEISGLAHG